MWSVYIIQTKKGKLYTGISTNVKRRFQQHLTGKGAKFFRSDVPVKVVFCKKYKNRSAASIEEARIKKLKRSEKFELCKIKCV
jgi:putative endonuclease